MNTSKRNGGLRIKDLALFNQALFAQQCWRLITQPNSLFARFFESKYFPNSHSLMLKLKPNPLQFGKVSYGEETFGNMDWVGEWEWGTYLYSHFKLGARENLFLNHSPLLTRVFELI